MEPQTDIYLLENWCPTVFFFLKAKQLQYPKVMLLRYDEERVPVPKMLILPPT
jgi:hypothetical protein